MANFMAIRAINGEMAEWSNAAVSKTVFRLSAERGFESPSLRKSKMLPFRVRRKGFLFYSRPSHALHERERM